LRKITLNYTNIVGVSVALTALLIILCNFSYVNPYTHYNSIIEITSHRYSFNIVLLTIFIVPISISAIYIIWHHNKKIKLVDDKNDITLGRPVPPIDYVYKIKQLSATVMQQEKLLNTERQASTEEIKRLKAQVKALSQQSDSLCVLLENEKVKRIKLEQSK